MDSNELTLFFEHVTGVSSKITGKPYDFYRVYVVVDGIRVYLYCKDKISETLLQNAIREMENELK